MSDRRVHATCANFSVVRYDRGGKWYVEPEASRRIHITVAEAAQRALSAETLGGTIFTGVSGGRTFDFWVEKLRARHGL